jgi:hypothetical protein
MTLRITLTATTDGADHAVRLAYHLSRLCGGLRYVVLSPYMRRFHKCEIVTDNHETERAILRLLSGDITGWHPRIASRFQRTMAYLRAEYIR